MNGAQETDEEFFARIAGTPVACFIELPNDWINRNFDKEAPKAEPETPP